MRLTQKASQSSRLTERRKTAIDLSSEPVEALRGAALAILSSVCDVAGASCHLIAKHAVVPTCHSATFECVKSVFYH